MMDAYDSYVDNKKMFTSTFMNLIWCSNLQT